MYIVIMALILQKLWHSHLSIQNTSVFSMLLLVEVICFDSSPPKYSQIEHILLKGFHFQVIVDFLTGPPVPPAILPSLELLSILTEAQRTCFLDHTGVGDLPCIRAPDLQGLFSS